MNPLSRFLIIAGSGCIRCFVELLAFLFVFRTSSGQYQDQAGKLLVLLSTGDLHCSERPSFSGFLHFSEIGHE
jgi:hypothetical protein